MKIAILGDTHFGARNADPRFTNFFRKFYQDVFFPTLEDQGIRTILQLGDLFDTRKYLNLHSLAHAKDYFFDEIEHRHYIFHSLIGNHDIYYRESLDITSPEQVLKEYESVKIWSSAGTYTTPDGSGTTIDIVPWICKENEKDVVDFIKQSRSDLLLGHFEIDGFAMYRGMAAHGGLSPAMFEKYELVLSGHFHTKSSAGNITYVGTPYELTWQDAGDPRGFHIFDTETRVLSFVPNPYNIFCRFEYDEDLVQPFPDVQDKFVRIVVVNKKSQEKFERYIEAIQKAGPYEVKVVEDMSSYREGELDENIDLEDTMSLMSNYVDSVETTADKEKIKNYMKTLYVESINLEE